MRKQIIWVIIIAFFVGALGSIAIGRFAIPYLATFNGMSFLNKLSSNSQLVINRTQEIQLNEGANLVDLIKQAGNITVSIYDQSDNFLGNGVIATSDGVIFTSDSILLGQTKVKVVTNDGKNFDGLARAKDPKSTLVILTITANDLPVVQLDDAANMEAGQRVIYVGRSNAPFQHLAVTGFVTQKMSNLVDKAEQVSTDVTVKPDLYGGPIINLSGHAIGITLGAGDNIISENLRTDLGEYLATGKLTP
ncbi:MAG: trypsin-like peptidase domain-containing protein [Candidatus Doudnabacteria bacterium]